MSDGAGSAAGSTERVRAALAEAGAALDIQRFDASTRTAEDAAAAIGCTVAQIAKSLVFRGEESDRPVLVIASGVNRIDERKVEALIGEAIGRADAQFVRERTGFAIGGVAPVGHREPPVVVIDEDLMALEEIWAAAGTPNAVFRLSPELLTRITGGALGPVRKD